jgi:hypothetical protein
MDAIQGRDRKPLTDRLRGFLFRYVAFQTGEVAILE